MSVQTLIAPLGVPTVESLAPLERHLRYESTAARSEIWNPWGRKARPSTAAEEEAFVDRLRVLAASVPGVKLGESRAYQRREITAVVTALRSSVTADEMLKSARGLRVEVVLAAYEEVELRRARAVDGWNAIVAEPAAKTLVEHGHAAAHLLPVAISRLRAIVLRDPADAAGFVECVDAFDRQVLLTRARALEVESVLSDGVAEQSVLAECEHVLYDEYGEGLWSLGSFLPPRVGTLTPNRLAALLGEERTDPRRSIG
jgi:hypothetical protein